MVRKILLIFLLLNCTCLGFSLSFDRMLSIGINNTYLDHTISDHTPYPGLDQDLPFTENLKIDAVGLHMNAFLGLGNLGILSMMDISFFPLLTMYQGGLFNAYRYFSQTLLIDLLAGGGWLLEKKDYSLLIGGGMHFANCMVSGTGYYYHAAALFNTQMYGIGAGAVFIYKLPELFFWEISVKAAYDFTYDISGDSLQDFSYSGFSSTCAVGFGIDF